MIIKLLGNPNFNGELYKTQFVEGISLEHVNKHTFDMIRDVLGLEPVVIEKDVECSKCEQHKVTIKELELRIEQLEEKLRKKVK